MLLCPTVALLLAELRARLSSQPFLAPFLQRNLGSGLPPVGGLVLQSNEAMAGPWGCLWGPEWFDSCWDCVFRRQHLLPNPLFFHWERCPCVTAGQGECQWMWGWHPPLDRCSFIHVFAFFVFVCFVGCGVAVISLRASTSFHLVELAQGAHLFVTPVATSTGLARQCWDPRAAPAAGACCRESFPNAP